MEPAKVVHFEKAAAGCSYTGLGAFLSDGKSVVFASAREVHVFDTVSGKRLRVFSGHQATVTGLAVLGADLVGSVDQRRELMVWRVSSAARLFRTIGDGMVFRAEPESDSSDAGFGSDSTESSGSSDVAYIDSTHFLFREGSGNLNVFEHLDGTNIGLPTVSKVSSWDRNLCMGVGAGKIVTGARRKGIGAFVWCVENGKIGKYPRALQWPTSEYFDYGKLKVLNISVSEKRIVLSTSEVFCIYNAGSGNFLKSIAVANVHPYRVIKGHTKTPIVVGSRYLLLRYESGHCVLDLLIGSVVEGSAVGGKDAEGYWGMWSIFYEDGRFAAFDCCFDLAFVRSTSKVVSSLILDHAVQVSPGFTLMLDEADLPEKCSDADEVSGQVEVSGGKRSVKRGPELCASQHAKRHCTDGKSKATDLALPDFASLKKRGVNRDVIVTLGRDEIAELLAAFLVVFREEEEAYFSAARESVACGLLDAGVFDGELLVGNEAAVEVDEFVNAILKRLEKDDLVKASTAKRLKRFGVLLAEAPLAI